MPRIMWKGMPVAMGMVEKASVTGWSLAMVGMLGMNDAISAPGKAASVEPLRGLATKTARAM